MTQSTLNILDPVVRSRLMDDLAVWRGRRVVAAMSGGVDSSLAAALLRAAGAQVTGVRMRLFGGPQTPAAGPEGRCVTPATADELDAARVAESLGIPFHVLPLHAVFAAEVIKPFVQTYLAGRTPNPCVICNRRIKLGALLDFARQLGAEAIATGHYVRVAAGAGSERVALLTAANRDKDQSYYLARLTQDQLRRFITPLGALSKPQTRALARELGLHVHAKSDSLEICFIPDNDYRRFLADHDHRDPATGREAAPRAAPPPLSAPAGEIVNRQGKVLGYHAGIHHFTIGQRKGLGIAAERPLYVLALDPITRRVIVGFEEETAGCELTVSDLNWVSMVPSSEPFRASVKIRYRSPGDLATVFPVPAGNQPPTRARIVFDQPVRSITPGQSAVAYDEPGERVLAAGWID